jgi:hypothetical protein
MTSTATALMRACSQLPAQEGQACDDQHHGHEDRAHAIDDALNGGLGGLGRFDHADDAGQRRLGADGRRADGQRAFGIDGAAGHLVADALGHRQALAGDQRLVDVAAAFDDVAVDGHAVTGAHDDEVADHDLFDRNVHLDITAAHAGGGRAQRVESADGIGRLPLRALLEPLAEQHQRDDGGGGLEVQVRHAVCGMFEEQVDREPVGRRGAQRHQQVHVAGLGDHRLPARAVEAPAEPELHRGRQRQLQPAVQHPVDAEELKQHRQDERQRQSAAHGDGPPGWKTRGRLRLCILDLPRGVAGLFDGGFQRCDRHRRQRLDGRLLGREIDRGAGNPGHLEQRLLDTRNTRGAGHAFNLKRGLGRCNVIAGLAHGSGQRICGHRGIGIHRGLFSRQIDAGLPDAGD